MVGDMENPGGGMPSGFWAGGGVWPRTSKLLRQKFSGTSANGLLFLRVTFSRDPSHILNYKLHLAFHKRTPLLKPWDNGPKGIHDLVVGLSLLDHLDLLPKIFLQVFRSKQQLKQHTEFRTKLFKIYSFLHQNGWKSYISVGTAHTIC